MMMKENLKKISVGLLAVGFQMSGIGFFSGCATAPAQTKTEAQEAQQSVQQPTQQALQRGTASEVAPNANVNSESDDERDPASIGKKKTRWSLFEGTVPDEDPSGD